MDRTNHLGKVYRAVEPFFRDQETLQLTLRGKPGNIRNKLLA